MSHYRARLRGYRASIVFLQVAALVLLAPRSAGANPTAEDEKSRVLLEQMAATMRSARTLEAQMDIVFTRTDKLTGPEVERSKGIMRLRKPNFAYAVTTGEMYQVLASDGKSRWKLYEPTTYVKRNATGDGRNLSFHMAFLVNYFFTQNVDMYGIKERTGKDMAVRYVGRGTIESTPTEIVELSGKIPELVSLTFHIGPDHLLRRSIIRHDGESVNLLYDARYSDIHIDRDLPAGSFAFAPPKGSQPFRSEEPVDRLRKVGTKAPGFSLPTPQKGVITLDGVLKNARAVIVNFWFYG